MTAASRTERPKRWGPTTDEVVRAAVLLYFDEQSDDHIAAELGVCRRTLARWKHRPDFVLAEQVIDELTTEQIVRSVV